MRDRAANPFPCRLKQVNKLASVGLEFRKICIAGTSWPTVQAVLTDACGSSINPNLPLNKSTRGKSQPNMAEPSRYPTRCWFKSIAKADSIDINQVPHQCVYRYCRSRLACHVLQKQVKTRVCLMLPHETSHFCYGLNLTCFGLRSEPAILLL